MVEHAEFRHYGSGYASLVDVLITRLLARHARPSRRHLGKPTDLEQRTGWR